MYRNQHLTAARGREPGLRLERRDGEIALFDWALEIIDQCKPIAAAVDAAQGGTAYAQSLADARATLIAPQRLPSARVLEAMARDFDQSYTAFVRAQSRDTREALLRLPYGEDLALRFEALADESLQAQRRVEDSDSVPFETYRQQYLAPERLKL